MSAFMVISIAHNYHFSLLNIEQLIFTVVKILVLPTVRQVAIFFIAEMVYICFSVVKYSITVFSWTTGSIKISKSGVAGQSYCW